MNNLDGSKRECDCDRCNGRPFEVVPVPESMKHLFPKIPVEKAEARSVFDLTRSS